MVNSWNESLTTIRTREKAIFWRNCKKNNDKNGILSNFSQFCTRWLFAWVTGSSTTFEVKVRNFLQEGKYVRSWPILLLGQGMIVLHERNANASKKRKTDIDDNFLLLERATLRNMNSKHSTCLYFDLQELSLVSMAQSHFLKKPHCFCTLLCYCD